MFKAKINDRKHTRKSEQEPNKENNSIVLLPVDAICPNPAQPRRDFDEVAIVNLADSIRQHGLLQPITVRRAFDSPSSYENESTNDPDESGKEETPFWQEDSSLAPRYHLIAGERRLRAFRMLGKKEIPAIVVETTSLQSAELAIIENIMRKDLNMFEYALALSTLIDKYEITQEELAEKMSTSQSNIANKLRLLRFAPEEQQFLLRGGLSERHARALLRIADPAARQSAAAFVVSHALNVKQTEQYIDKLLMPEEKPAEDPAKKISSFCDALVRSLASINKTGIPARSTRFETDSEIKIVINIPKIAS